MDKNANTQSPVLLIGGSGIVGTLAAQTLRRLHPHLPITIGGRNIQKAKRVAKKLGHANAVGIDLEQSDLGLPVNDTFSAVVMFVKDPTLHSLRYAQEKGIPYLNISGAAFEIGPEVAHFVHRPMNAPMLMNSYWLAGTMLLATLSFAKEFDTIHSIEIAALLDEEDMGGPAAYADFERLSKAGPYALILQEGKWVWATGKERFRDFQRADGSVVHGEAYSAPLDVNSLAVATQAQSVRFDFALGETSTRRRGEPFSIETFVDIVGQRTDGTSGRFRYALIHPDGQAPMTALGVALCTERLLGLAGGHPIKPGLYFPEVLLDSAYVVEQLAVIGTHIDQQRIDDQ